MLHPEPLSENVTRATVATPTITGARPPCPRIRASGAVATPDAPVSAPRPRRTTTRPTYGYLTPL